MSSTSEKVEFASPAWIAAIGDVLEKRLAGVELGGRTITVSEEFTDPPPHLLAEGATSIAWHFRVSEDGVEVFDGVGQDADLRTTVDYQAVLPIARLVYGTEPEDLAQLQQWRAETIASGKLERVGDETTFPPDLMPRLFAVHNDIALRTL